MRQSVTSQWRFKAQPGAAGIFEGGSIKYKGEEIITKTDREVREKSAVWRLDLSFRDPMTSIKPDHDGWKTDRGGFCRTEGDDPGESQGAGRWRSCVWSAM
ncbi:MAG: hypothetical protein ACLTR6_05330 [Clostridium fessum]